MRNPCIIEGLRHSNYTCKTNEFKQNSINYYKRRSCGDVQWKREENVRATSSNDVARTSFSRPIKTSKGRRRDVATRRPNETCRRRSRPYEQNDVLRTSANYIGTTKLDT